MSTVAQRDIARDIFGLTYSAKRRRWELRRLRPISTVGRIAITLEKGINPHITTWRATRNPEHLAWAHIAYLDTRTLRLAGNVYKAFGFEALCGFIDGTKTGGDVCGQRRET